MVSASLRLDFGLPLFTAPVVPTLVVTGARAPAAGMAAARAAGAEVVVAGEGTEADPRRIRAELARRGYTRLLSEGGPRLLALLAAAGALDELCLTIAPRLTAGQAARVMNGRPLDVPGDLELTGLLEDSGYLFSRYRTA